MNPAIYGLIGYPVRHSLSPLMHNAAFKKLGIDAEYRLFEVRPEELENFLLKDVPVNDSEGKRFSSQEIKGFNITIPHKVRAREILWPIDGSGLIKNITVRQEYYVFLSGAINTVKRDLIKLYYYNTDAEGFMKSIEEDLALNTNGKNVLVFGCGGAGRAVIAGLTWKNTGIKKIYIYDTSKEVIESAKKHFSRFDFVKDKLEFISLEQVPEKIKEVNLLVNASPVGMKEGDSSVVDSSLLHKGLYVYDVVYNRKTQLIKDVEQLGLLAVGGSGMLLYQGVAAFELWTGKKAPVEVMREALEKGLRQCQSR